MVLSALSDAPLIAADVVLHATDREFDLGFDSLPVGHHYVGPLLWDPPGKIPPVMAEPGPPWVTASVSTVIQPGEMDLIRTILDAVDGLPARVLLTAPDHDHAQAGVVPANVLLERFVPHGPALQRSRLMLSHAGHGVVMKALWHGVPMVLTPWGRDQHGVAHRAANLGSAIVVPRRELSADVLRRVLARALADPDLLATAERHGERLRATDPVALACNILAGAT